MPKRKLDATGHDKNGFDKHGLKYDPSNGWTEIDWYAGKRKAKAKLAKGGYTPYGKTHLLEKTPKRFDAKLRKSYRTAIANKSTEKWWKKHDDVKGYHENSKRDVAGYFRGTTHPDENNDWGEKRYGKQTLWEANYKKQGNDWEKHKKTVFKERTNKLMHSKGMGHLTYHFANLKEGQRKYINDQLKSALRINNQTNYDDSAFNIAQIRIDGKLKQIFHPPPPPPPPKKEWYEDVADFFDPTSDTSDYNPFLVPSTVVRHARKALGDDAMNIVTTLLEFTPAAPVGYAIDGYMAGQDAAKMLHDYVNKDEIQAKAEAEFKYQGIKKANEIEKAYIKLHPSS